MSKQKQPTVAKSHVESPSSTLHACALRMMSTPLERWLDGVAPAIAPQRVRVPGHGCTDDTRRRPLPNIALSIRWRVPMRRCGYVCIDRPQLSTSDDIGRARRGMRKHNWHRNDCFQGAIQINVEQRRVQRVRRLRDPTIGTCRGYGYRGVSLKSLSSFRETMLQHHRLRS